MKNLCFFVDQHTKNDMVWQQQSTQYNNTCVRWQRLPGVFVFSLALQLSSSPASNAIHKLFSATMVLMYLCILSASLKVYAAVHGVLLGLFISPPIPSCTRINFWVFTERGCERKYSYPVRACVLCMCGPVCNVFMMAQWANDRASTDTMFVCIVFVFCLPHNTHFHPRLCVYVGALRCAASHTTNAHCHKLWRRP